MSQRLPNAALHVFNRSGHSMAVEVPGELAAVIDDFIQRGVVTAATPQQAVAAQRGRTGLEGASAR